MKRPSKYVAALMSGGQGTVDVLLIVYCNSCPLLIKSVVLIYCYWQLVTHIHVSRAWFEKFKLLLFVTVMLQNHYLKLSDQKVLKRYS